MLETVNLAPVAAMVRHPRAVAAANRLREEAHPAANPQPQARARAWVDRALEVRATARPVLAAWAAVVVHRSGLLRFEAQLGAHESGWSEGDHLVLTK